MGNAIHLLNNLGLKVKVHHTLGGKLWPQSLCVYWRNSLKIFPAFCDIILLLRQAAQNNKLLLIIMQLCNLLGETKSFSSTHEVSCQSEVSRLHAAASCCSVTGHFDTKSFQNKSFRYKLISWSCNIVSRTWLK